MRQPRHRDNALDGLRAFAVGLVVIKHIEPDKLPGGFVGVDIFFALSGYLITSLLVNEFETTGQVSFVNFYIRRSARLFPAFGLLLIAAALTVYLLPSAGFNIREVVIAGTYTMNWARALNLGDSVMLGHTWSLAAEEQFYLFWPPLLVFVLKLRPSFVSYLPISLAIASTVTGVVLFLSGAPLSRTYNGFDVRAVEMLVGCAAAFLPLSGIAADALARFWYFPVIAIAIALTIHDNSALLPLGGYAILGLLASWIVIAVRKRAPLIVLLENPIVVYLGRISYGIYLWHFFLIALMRAIGWPHWVELLFVPGATVLIASVSFYFVERPILKATRRRADVLPLAA